MFNAVLGTNSGTISYHFFCRKAELVVFTDGAGGRDRHWHNQVDDVCAGCTGCNCSLEDQRPRELRPSLGHETGTARHWPTSDGHDAPSLGADDHSVGGAIYRVDDYLDPLGLQVNLVSRACVRRPKLIPKKNSGEADKVFTSRLLAAQIIDRCRGGGAFYDQFPHGIT